MHIRVLGAHLPRLDPQSIEKFIADDTVQFKTFMAERIKQGKSDWTIEKVDERALEIADDLRTDLRTCALFEVEVTDNAQRFHASDLSNPVTSLCGWAKDRSRAAHVVHNKTAPEIEEALVRLRLRFPRWGARKLVHEVGLASPQWQMPAESTVCDMLSRRGLIESKPRRKPVGHAGRPSVQVLGPNDCWSADYEGQFRLGNGQYCYPLTVTDNHSRYLLACQGLAGTLLEPTKAVLTRVFKEYGLPRRIRTDNCVPFSAATLGRLSQLSVWWITATGQLVSLNPLVGRRAADAVQSAQLHHRALAAPPIGNELPSLFHRVDFLPGHLQAPCRARILPKCVNHPPREICQPCARVVPS